MQASQRIEEQLAAQIRVAIEEAGGAEVLFVCDAGPGGVLSSIAVVARGSPTAVPAPAAQMQRGRVVVHNHPSGVLLPSDHDVAVAAELASSGIGSYIVDNEVEHIAVVVEPIDAPALEPLAIDELADILDAGGKLAVHKPGFEPRPTQIELLRQIAAAFNGDELSVAEAGTGVGKSYAYLIPAIAWAEQNAERVVVSTATINLQQQLIEKDIPTVRSILGSSIKAVLVKGRGNYLCKVRLAEAAEEDSLFNEGDEEIAAIRAWVLATIDGSRSDLPTPIRDSSWSRVNAEADSCTGIRCTHHGDCFFFRARREAAEARVLVVNHHLLFSDLSIRVGGLGYEATAVLPPFQRLIIDEAHNTESSATSFFSDSFSRAAVRKHTGRLLRTRGGKRFGLLLRLESMIEVAARQRARRLCASVEEAADALEATAIAVVGTTGERVARLPHDLDASQLEELRGALAELRSRLLLLHAELSPLLDSIDESDEPRLLDLRLVVRRLNAIASLCREFSECGDHPERVFFIELRRRGDGAMHARFAASPLDVGTVLAEAVYEVFPTVVFTSATLTVGGRFDFWFKRVGLLLTGRELSTGRFASPFDYARNVLLAVPSDAPPPSAAGFQSFMESLLERLLDVSEGSALVLFTSYEMLNRTYESLRGGLATAGIRLLRQGDEDRARLLQRFTTERTSVLFATESFWQGVDAPGETLRVLVICRLPFRVPNDPVVAARMEAIEAAGGNAFADLSLPDAVMRFTQGFGRLIRSRRDYGVVVVLDSRILTRRYGSVFLESLPETRRSNESSETIVDTVERFLYEPRS